MSEPFGADTAQELVSICAIGASAGGVGALQKLFARLPTDLGLAYVIVLHLPADHRSILDELLAASTQMPALQVSVSAELKADHIYVIAPSHELVVEGDLVKARRFDDASALHLPVDTLFRSIAESRGDGIAVVMSGAGHDGSHGIRAIKEGGGIVLVQDPAEAEYAAMPQSAIETGAADFVEPIALLAERIAEIARGKHAIRNEDTDESSSVRKILTLARTRTGHDFSGYKAGTVLRRIKRRALLSRRQSIAEYAAYVRNNPAESKQLLGDLLISVTSFFRDKDAFAALERSTIGPLFERAENELRGWAVGCASGEEVYSIAILLLEEAERRNNKMPIQLFATDLDDDALAKARMGLYPKSIEADVSTERLKRFFVDEGGHYRVCGELRDMVLFATHSVVRDPPFTRLDLIVCRNLVIYFERQLQQQITSIFHYALKTGGYLFLGPAEMPDMSLGLFDIVDREARVYRSAWRETTGLPLVHKMVPNPYLARSGPRPVALPRAGAGPVDLLDASHAAALEERAPPSVVVDRDRRVVNLSPSAGRFILLPGGPITEQLPAIVRPELRGELMIALDRAFESAAPIITRPAEVSFEREKRQVALYVAQLADVQGTMNRALVCFVDGGPSGQPGAEPASSDPQEEEIRRLRGDLSAAQQAALMSRAEHEAALQDLRVANEELQSLNEEYRSTAEELETSKEELQSVNEELHTVNAELRHKVQAISVAHNDLLNLTASSEIGTLFLDPDLKIRMFTPPIAKLFSVVEVDVGRPITDFAHHLLYGDLESNVRDVLNSLTPIEREIRGPLGRSLLLRIRPYRTTDDRVTGVVVTFNDITDRMRKSALGENEARFDAFVTVSFEVIYRMNADWSEMLGLEGRDLLADTAEPSRTWMETYVPEADRDGLRAAIARAVRDKGVFDAEHRVFRRDGSIGRVRSRAVPIIDETGDISEWLGTAIDVTATEATPSAAR